MSAIASDPIPKRGRPSYDAETKRIRLKQDVFDSWIRIKEISGYATKSNSQFAEFLLENIQRNDNKHSALSPLCSPSSTGTGKCKDLFCDFLRH